MLLCSSMYKVLFTLTKVLLIITTLPLLLLAFILLMDNMLSILRSSHGHLKPTAEITDAQMLQILSVDSVPSTKNDSVLNHFCWNDKYIGMNCIEYKLDIASVMQESYFRDKHLHKNLNFAGSAETRLLWQSIYGELFKFNPKALSHIGDSLRDIAKKRKLNHLDYARLIVSYGQSMPYWYIIHQNTCDSAPSYRYPCISGIPYGLLTPQETAALARGDCDSKSLMLYNLLRYLGFEALLVISDQYAHAMLAVQTYTTGAHVFYNGKSYYFWETTAKGWDAGMLPPDVANTNYWKIALTHEY